MADLKLLQGRWIPTRFEENGLVDPPDTHSAPGAVLTIHGQSFRVAIPGAAPVLEGAFQLDARSLPKSITWIDSMGEDAGKPLAAIYSLTEENFTFVAADSGAPRPDRLAGGPGLTLRSFVRV